MKKEYGEPVIAFFLIGEKDIIRTSNFINYNDLSGNLNITI